MPPSPISSHVLEPSNVLLHLSPQVILNSHSRELSGEFEDRAILETTDPSPGVNMESRHDLLRHFGADAIEGFEGALDPVRRGVGNGVGVNRTLTSDSSGKLIPNIKTYRY